MSKVVLSEYDSKKILQDLGIRVCKEIIVEDMVELKDGVEKIGFPLVMKPSMEGLSHKTEQGLVFLDVKSLEEAKKIYANIKDKLPQADVLIEEMVDNKREVVVGFIVDDIMGPCVMFGLGGIFTEILKDTTFRIAPVDHMEARDMVFDIRSKKILDNVRGLPPVNIDEICDIIVTISNIPSFYPEIVEVDINPICFDKNGLPVVVDCSVVKME